MRHNVPVTVNADAIDARQSTSPIGEACLGPGDSSLHNVVGDIEIGLHRHIRVGTHKAIIGIPEMEAPEHVGSCRIKGPHGADRILDRQELDMDIAAVNFQHITPLAVSAVQNRDVIIGAIDETVCPADHDRVLGCTTGSNLPASRVSASRQCNDVARLRRAEGAGQLRRAVHMDD